MPRGLPTLFMIVLLALGVGLWAWVVNKPGQASTPSTAVTLPPSHPGGLRVMAANIRLSDPADGDNAWTNRRDIALKTFLKYQPDILACQEVSPAQGAFLNKELAGGYAYFPRAGIGTVTAAPSTAAATGRGAAAALLTTLSDALATLNTIYYRNDRFDAIDGEAGLVLPDQPQSNVTENTFFSLVLLREKLPTASAQTAPSASAGPPPHNLLVVNVHFRHNEDFAIRCAQRLREKITAWQNKFPDRKPDVILLGDINHDRTSPLYPVLCGSPAHPPAFTDTFDYASKTSPPTGTYHAFSGNPVAALPTDLIFFSGSLKVAPGGSAQILHDHGPPPQTRQPSDHFFVMADLTPR